MGLRIPSGRTRIAPALTPVYPPEPAADRLTEVQDFGGNPGALRMFVHVPERLPEAAPLVVILHGCGQTAASYDHGAGWSALGDRLGFAVLAPEQQNANNMAGCFNWFQPGDTLRDAGEAASIRQMIVKLVTSRRLDPARIFITGLSAGGAMTAAMLAAYPEIFAGGAIIAGLPYGAAANVPEALNSMRHAPQHSPQEWGQAVRDASAHDGPWPALSVWHGDADATVHVSNADAILGQWAHLHGLPAQPSETLAVEGHTRRSWRRADGTVPLESYTLAGMGHGTPVHAGTDIASCGNAGPYFLEAGLASTLQIAEFWGLKRPSPHSVSPPVVAGRAAPRRARPAPVAVPVEEASEEHREVPVESQPPTPAPPQSRSGLRAVILKALKAAGLVKD
jgi:feruloyl esterase